MIRTTETPTPISATIVKKVHGWNLVRLVWQDNADGEGGTQAGFSDASGQWMFVTQDMSADAYGSGTGQRTVDVYAPKEAASVQLQAHWAGDNVTPGDVTPLSPPIPITKG